jgi:hypothetical protein
MITPDLVVPLGDADKLAQKLLALGNSLRPIDDENFYFFEIVRELVDAAIKNFNELRRGNVSGSLNLVAWASRNLLELTVFTKYVLKSAGNARRFGDDRLVDECELIIALRDLEHYCDPAAPTLGLDDALSRMKAQDSGKRDIHKASGNERSGERGRHGAGISVDEPGVVQAGSSDSLVHACREFWTQQLS